MSSHQTLIQGALLLATVGLALLFVAKRKKARAKAGVKLGFLVFVVVCIWAILRPDDLTIVAHWLGVSRGTDLLLYCLVVAFMFTTVSAYIRFREQELRFARLARAIALQTAIPPEEEAPNPERRMPSTAAAKTPRREEQSRPRR